MDDRDFAILELGRVLFNKMEHIRPEGIDWDNASEGERDFCVYCALAVASRLDLILRVHNISLPDDNKGIIYLT